MQHRYPNRAERRKGIVRWITDPETGEKRSILVKRARNLGNLVWKRVSAKPTRAERAARKRARRG